MRAGDGLTTEELRRSRQSFWDESFTGELASRIAADARTLVDVGCGLATAARALLPLRPALRYVGVDPSAERLAEGRLDLPARALLLRSVGQELPLASGTADVVLSTMTLQHVADIGPLLVEARRVLARGGRFVAVEPDNLGQRAHFDGVLEETNPALLALSERARACRRPADIAIGPAVGRHLAAAGFEDVDLRVLALQSVRFELPSATRERLSFLARTIAAAAGMTEGCEEVRRVDAALESDLGDRRQPGFSVSTVPVFLWSALGL